MGYGAWQFTRRKGRGYNKNRDMPYRPCPGRCCSPKNGAPRFLYDDLIKDDTFCDHCGAYYGGCNTLAPFKGGGGKGTGKGGGKGNPNRQDVGAASPTAYTPLSDFVLANFSKEVLSSGLDYTEAVKQLNLKGQDIGKFAKLCNKVAQPVSHAADPLKDNRRSVSDKVNKLDQLVTKRLPSLLRAVDECVATINRLKADIATEQAQYCKLLAEETRKVSPQGSSNANASQSSFMDKLQEYLNDPASLVGLEGHMQGLKDGTISFACPPPAPHPSPPLDEDTPEFGDMDPNLRSDVTMRREGKRGREDSCDPGDVFTDFPGPAQEPSVVSTGKAAVVVSDEEPLRFVAKRASTAASSSGDHSPTPPPVSCDPQAMTTSIEAALAIIHQHEHDANVAPFQSIL